MNLKLTDKINSPFGQFKTFVTLDGIETPVLIKWTLNDRIVAYVATDGDGVNVTGCLGAEDEERVRFDCRGGRGLALEPAIA